LALVKTIFVFVKDDRRDAMRRVLDFVASVVFLAVLSTASPAQASIITFEAQPIGLTDPFVIGVDGINVSFASPAVFSVGASFFSTLTGHILLDADPIVGNLVIGFSSLVQNVSLNFATNSGVGPSLLLQAFTGGIGGTLVGSASVAGVVPIGLSFPEGVIGLSGVAFDTLRLSTTAQDFAVDNIQFVNAVPEPTSLLLFGSGAIGVVVSLRRKKKQRT